MVGSKYPSSVLSDVLEALIAAIYLDGGIEAARAFVESHIFPEVDAAEDGETENYKSQLQQLTQRKFGSTPIYHLIDEQGPDHSKCFRIAAQVATERFAPAWGRNKKEAEQRAACNALWQMRKEDPPPRRPPGDLISTRGPRRITGYSHEQVASPLRYSNAAMVTSPKTTPSCHVQRPLRRWILVWLSSQPVGHP